ncbi:hypothetical protein ILYODFUR_026325 [Ilyodon furcidens]|uniref:Uncharacterized protein n=1 Tax=Ilyodon furcidens TaxID=33524 RepID=A0ABV0SPE2_9TELE
MVFVLYVSVLPCDGLATCPGCTPPVAHKLLEIGMSVGSQEEMFTFVLRCLPILALITAFFWLYYIGTKAQQNKAAVLGNKASSEQKIEEDQKEKKKEECVTKEKEEEEEEKEKSI